MRAELNGSPQTTIKPTRKPRVRKTPLPQSPAQPPSRYKLGVTIAMGCGIPLLSLSLSSIGGALIESEQRLLGITALVLTCGVLAVSLSHLASAIRDITRSSLWQSWALAIVIDCSLVVCELTRVAGFSSWVVPTVMVGVTGFSMLLNCHAFLDHED